MESVLVVPEPNFPPSHMNVSVSIFESVPASVGREAVDAEIDADGSSEASSILRLSASAARRQRRQRAAAHREQQQMREHSSVSSAQGPGHPPQIYTDMLARLENGGAGLQAVLAEIRGSVRRLTF